MTMKQVQGTLELIDIDKHNDKVFAANLKGAKMEFAKRKTAFQFRKTEDHAGVSTVDLDAIHKQKLKEMGGL